MKKIRTISKLLFIAIITVIFISASHSKTLENDIIEAYKLYNADKFQEVIALLEKTKDIQNKKQKYIVTRYYLLATSYKSNYQFEDASKYFKKIIKSSNIFKDIYYEYGQNLYSANRLINAVKMFKKSSISNYKRSESNYYIAHINQINRNFQESSKYFYKIIRDENASNDLKQVSYFHLAEILIDISQKKHNIDIIIKNNVIPHLKKAISYASESLLAKQIIKKIFSLEIKYKLSPYLMKNGRLLTSKKYELQLKQGIEYDSNVPQYSTSQINAETKKSSFISQTSISGQYQFILNKRFTFSPFLFSSKSYYFDKSEDQIKKNNGHNISIGSKNTIEHNILKNIASFIFNFDIKKSYRDINSIDEVEYEYTKTSVSIREQLNLKGLLSHGLTYKFDDYQYYSQELNQKSNSIIYTISSPIFKNHYTNYSIDASTNRIINNLYDTNSYKFDFFYTSPIFIDFYRISINTSLKLVDNINQQDTRGTEKYFDNSFNISRSNKNYTINFNFNLIKNNSKNKSDYDYTKYIISTNLIYKL